MDAQGQSIENIGFEEQVAILMEDLPQPLRAFLRGPERDAVSLQLTQKYQLHADQGGAFERAYLYLLLGVNTPDEFVQDLRSAGVEEQKIRGLATDINELVFKRIQQQERQGAPAVQPAPLPAPSLQPVEKDSPANALQSAAFSREMIADAYQRAPASVRAALSNPATAQIIRSIRTGHRLPAEVAGELGAKVGFLMLGLLRTNELKEQLVRAGAAPDAAENAVTEIQQKILDLFTQAPAPVSAEPVPVSPVPTLRTMAKDMEFAMHPDLRQAAIHPAQASPARSFQTASVPSTVPPPPVAPPAPTFVPPPSPAVAPHTEWKPATPSDPANPIVKQYSVDPYRELPE